ncbi:hypothetical protein CROQUDRAFT_664390 [Cronartium quercuum f. sp. fusiforme G11]|uniref:Protein kinase domain-containing protein n=1 Tax=Cronartium quercuum f. sp. fusiforme G11 TaxID=708437 RepID=A0A9P6NB71_9BASI|nr:hypothetical protein CROQUDRAFT_664390 [Cronartium quercuum f. sp. fusiforme G11]
MGPFNFTEVSYYLVQIATGLYSLHSSKIIYRDLKPANILLDNKGHIKLGDFGLSKDVGSSEGRADTICGTLHYMAPEVLEGLKSYSYSIDWYSLGIMIHELYTGEFPFSNEILDGNRQQLLETIIRGEIIINSRIDPEGQSFILWLTNSNPERRPQTIDQIKTHPWVSRLAWSSILSKNEFVPHILDPNLKIRPDLIDPTLDNSSKYETEEEDQGSVF